MNKNATLTILFVALIVAFTGTILIASKESSAEEVNVDISQDDLGTTYLFVGEDGKLWRFFESSPNLLVAMDEDAYTNLQELAESGEIISYREVFNKNGNIGTKLLIIENGATRVRVLEEAGASKQGVSPELVLALN